MTYSSGSLIQASDYNGFTGSSAPNLAYGSSGAATQKVWALIGVGFGDRGYGQTSTSNIVVAAGNTVSAAQWNYLINAMGIMNTHQGSGLTPPVTAVVGQSVTAQSVIPSNIVTLDSNRLNSTPTDMTLSSVLTSSIGTWNTIVVHAFTMTFASEDAARYFFNSGGQLRWTGSNVGGTTPPALDWAAILDGMGSIIMGAYSTSYMGTGGVIPNNIGYYGLTGTPTEIFYHNGAAGPYSGTQYKIEVSRSSYVGANGGNGSVINCTVTFNDATAGAVDGTTSSVIYQYKATGVLTIADPVFVTTTPL